METILTAVGFMAALGLLLATVLVLANRRLYVFEDPRIDEVEDLLPMANCGACGTAGCRQFAEKLVKGEIEPGKCTVNAKEMNQVIADFLGVDLGGCERRVARLACAGWQPCGLQARLLQRHPVLSRRRAGLGWWAGLLLGLPGPGGLRRGLRVRRHPSESTRFARCCRGQVYGLRRLCDGLPQGPLQPAPGESPAVGGLQEPAVRR
jgi:hypothetical protein